jgi:hypothetical protein
LTYQEQFNPELSQFNPDDPVATFWSWKLKTALPLLRSIGEPASQVHVTYPTWLFMLGVPMDPGMPGARLIAVTRVIEGLKVILRSHPVISLKLVTVTCTVAEVPVVVTVPNVEVGAFCACILKKDRLARRIMNSVVFFMASNIYKD